MTGVRLLDWAILAISLFDVIVPFWLGLTVLLNADRRSWSIWMAGGALLLGSLFFVSHTLLLGNGLYYVSQGMNFWWHVGWIPVVLLPFAWYLCMLWYAGYWEDEERPAGRGRRLLIVRILEKRDTPIHHRHRPWFFLTSAIVTVLVGLLLFANPLPPYMQVAQLRVSATPAVVGLPILLVGYPFHIILCISLSLDALHRPGPSARVLGQQARGRAGPWLMGASVALLLASLLVSAIMTWVVTTATDAGLRLTPPRQLVLIVGLFDLAISILITIAILLLGQAIVSYEVFTGKTLPRQGLRHHWRRAVILAAGYGFVVGGSLAFQIQPAYSLLATTILMVTFYALLTWRSYAERERSMERLRPFVASQRLYEQILTPSTPTGLADVDTEAPFHALCTDVLDARLAILVPLGPLAPLAGPPLVYPAGQPPHLPPLADLASRCESPQTICAALDPERYGGAVWAVGLWGARGLIGALLLGEKRGGGLYSQEEIEIARASGERLLDSQASAEMASRLMALQRQRLAQGQLLDQQARRVLHDDVLPRLHAVLLILSGDGYTAEAIPLLADSHRQIADLLRHMPTTTAPEVARLGLVAALRQAIAEELAPAFDQITWQVTPQVEERTRAIPTLTAEVLFYAAREAARNAARHGRSAGSDHPLHLTIGVTWADDLSITVEDDGIGLETSGGPSAGSGQGLALHSTMMAVIGGTLAVDSAPGAYTRVTLSLPHNAVGGQEKRERGGQ